VSRGIAVVAWVKGGTRHEGECQFDSMDDLRAHMQGDNAWLVLKVIKTFDDGIKNQVTEYYIRCSDVMSWSINYEE